MNQAFLPWAHNAYNSSYYSYPDPNQSESITDHLNAGLRMIDIDPIWNNHNERIEACHAICGPGDDPVTDRFEEIYE